MGMPPMNRPPIDPNMAGGGADPMDPVAEFQGSLEELRSSLPPHLQDRIDPSNPITQLLFKRLRDVINDEEGDALLELFGTAPPLALAAIRKVLPECIILLDVLDDGVVNDSVAGGDGGAEAGGYGGPPSAPPAGSRPEISRPAPRPAYVEDDEDEEADIGGAGAAARLASIRA